MSARAEKVGKRTRRRRARLQKRVGHSSKHNLDAQFARAGMELAEQQADYGTWFWHVASDTFHMTSNARAVMGVGDGDYDLDRMLTTVHEDDRAEVETRVRNYLENGDPYDISYRSCRLDGSVRWLRARGHIAQGADGAAEMM
ncbi:MAG: PAS domain-containing protein, partial [Rhodobiaceae bacterium]|nr:PAS domain-containing protein [Rhodobiaceae bacterium]